MARPCAICVHPSRLAIEQAILNGKPSTTIAVDFGFTYTRSKDGKVIGDHKMVTRHRDEHMGKAYETAVQEREVQSGVAIAKRLEVLDENVDRVLKAAWEGYPVLVGDVPLLNEDGSPKMAHDYRLILAAIREARGNAELLAKLAGRTETDAQDINAIRTLLDSPQARKIMAELDQVLADLEAAEDTGRTPGQA